MAPNRKSSLYPTSTAYGWSAAGLRIILLPGVDITSAARALLLFMS